MPSTGASLSLASTHLLGQQGNEVSLELGFNDLHHVLDLGGLAAINELIQSKKLLWATPPLRTGTSVMMPAHMAGPHRLPCGSVQCLCPHPNPSRDTNQHGQDRLAGPLEQTRALLPRSQDRGEPQRGGWELHESHKMEHRSCVMVDKATSLQDEREQEGD